jgi:hypothetical protein
MRSILKQLNRPNIDQEVIDWLEQHWAWLLAEFGENHLLELKTVLPNEDFFPETYDGSELAIQKLLERTANYMQIDPDEVQLVLYDESMKLPFTENAAGLYEEMDDHFRIWIDATRVEDPVPIIATIAHELGHVQLLGKKRISAERPDHEPLTDLITVFFGMGIFVANSALTEVNFRMGNYSSWQMSRKGYLTMPELGYALALFASSRKEVKPAWIRTLRPDVRQAFHWGMQQLSEKPLIEASSKTSLVFPQHLLEERIGKFEEVAHDSPDLCSFCGKQLTPEEMAYLEEPILCNECHESAEENEANLVAEEVAETTELGASFKLVIWIALASLMVLLLTSWFKKSWFLLSTER